MQDRSPHGATIFRSTPGQTAGQRAGGRVWPEGYRFSEGFFVTSDTLRLYRVALTRPAADFVVLYFGGSNFQIGQDYRRFTPLLKVGVDVIVADYPGYGESGGKSTLASFQRAALAAYDEALRVTGLPASRLIVHGHSLGTILATYVAEQRAVGGVVLEGPATNAREWAQSFTPWFARPVVRFDIPESLLSHDNLARVRRYRGPLLLLAGEKDAETKPEMARRLYAASATPADMKELVIFSGADHMILRKQAGAVEAYASFLRKIGSRQQ
jgi:pimeloyl-ACP methyl ester carboxylesterase